MDKLKLTTLILACLLLTAMGYILLEKLDICEQSKNESYAAGFNEGLEQWNNIIIYNVNNNGVIPYWFNGTYYELNINQMCGG